jgi:hypothetical protein
VVARGREAAAGVVRGGGGTREETLSRGEDMTVMQALRFSVVGILRQILSEPSPFGTVREGKKEVALCI